MPTDHPNCTICGTELTTANSFTCPNCGRTDFCIIHKGPASGLCAKCLDSFRKRIIYPTFTVIAVVLLIFSPYLFTILPPVMGYILILMLPFWLVIEHSRPVITMSRLRRILVNTIAGSVVMAAILSVGYNMMRAEQMIHVQQGIASITFLIVGIILILLGFVYILSTSLARLGIVFFNYDYPEESSLLLRKAGQNPEMVGVLKWDLKWITSVNFIYGFLFLYLYMGSLVR